MYSETQNIEDEDNTLFTWTTIGIFILDTALVALMLIKIWP